MIEKTPETVREALIESVPVLIGRTDREGLVLETEGSLTEDSKLGPLVVGETNLLELFPDNDEEIRAGLAGREVRLQAQLIYADGVAHFEAQLIPNRREEKGVYFMIHDVTETRELQIALLNCTDHEQIRMGQDVHDVLGQQLTGIAYRLHALHEQSPPRFSQSLQDLQDQVAQCLRQSRDLAFKLSPQIEGSEIVPAFERLAKHLSESFDADCTFTSSLEAQISDSGLAFNLFRIAQEACTNAVRHGGARTIKISLSTGDKNRLEISDDGSGVLPKNTPETPGMGIPMMRFRTESIGGSLRILNGSPSGTIVRCSFENKPAAVPEPDLREPCDTCS